MNLPTPLQNSQFALRNVSFSYQSLNVLRHITLNINANEFVAFIGPNGGGKSTLMKILLGLLQPSSGEIQRPAKRIGYVLQNTDVNIYFPITALGIVMMSQPRHTTSFQAQKERALTLLARVGIEHLANRRLSELSGGQRQRVMIARALQEQPEVLMLDEPTSNLDQVSQHALISLLVELNEHMTIVMISHDLPLFIEHVDKVAYIQSELQLYNGDDIQKNMHQIMQNYHLSSHLLHRNSDAEYMI